MTPYGERGQDSGVVAYELGPDFIRIRFKGGEEYVYPADKIGQDHLGKMERRARAGKGLTTYINRHPRVREGYRR